MNLNLSPLNISRAEGCTLTGALSVTTSVMDAVSIVHGPAGCAHHNFSLLHATGLDNDVILIPRIVSTAMSEKEVIFGGEDSLSAALQRVTATYPACIFVLTSCIADTIGDDACAVCRNNGSVPVHVIPSGGFLGGGFQTGYLRALCALSFLADEPGCAGGVTLIGEKNLEFEAEQNFLEVKRLLMLLDLDVTLRFVRKIPYADISRLSCGSLNILRDRGIEIIGRSLRTRFGTPFIGSFPVGLSGTLSFLREVAGVMGIDESFAVKSERSIQEGIIRSFDNIRGYKICLDGDSRRDPEVHEPLEELIDLLDLTLSPGGTGLPVPVPFPVGSNGIRRMLHRWRRMLRA
jgi:nitrogenase molybdenum-iron protein alpha/beta subunit